MNIPRMYRIRQRFAATRLDNVVLAVQSELANCGAAVRPGLRLAIAVGSRGISNLPLIVREVAGWVKARGGAPFIVPAMGSHGGATADGQRRVLERYGVTETSTGAPIISSMEVVDLRSLEGSAPAEPCPPLFFDRHAWESDGVILINRIKPHTSFHGRFESGLMKMLAIGLGKHVGATAIHKLGVGGLREQMPQVARAILRHGKVLLGVALVENAYDETMLVRAIPAAQIPDQEPSLLELARANMPSLPVADLDLLIVDEIGKDISGTGLDTNAIGRLRIAGQPEPTSPRIKTIFVRDLSPASGGSAYGIGLADVTTRRLVEKADWDATNANVQASGFIERGKLPHVEETDEQALQWALRQCAPVDPAAARVIRIKNTLRLDSLLVSEAVREEIAGRDAIEVLKATEDILGENLLL